jgi:hypothetical protein
MHAQKPRAATQKVRAFRFQTPSRAPRQKKSPLRVTFYEAVDAVEKSRVPLNFIDHHNARVPVLAGLGQVGPHEVLETGGVSLKRLGYSGVQKVDEQSLGPKGVANEGAFACLAWPHQKSTAMLQTGTEV